MNLTKPPAKPIFKNLTASGVIYYTIVDFGTFNNHNYIYGVTVQDRDKTYTLTNDDNHWKGHLRVLKYSTLENNDTYAKILFSDFISSERIEYFRSAPVVSSLYWSTVGDNGWEDLATRSLAYTQQTVPIDEIIEDLENDKLIIIFYPFYNPDSDDFDIQIHRSENYRFDSKIRYDREKHLPDWHFRQRYKSISNSDINLVFTPSPGSYLELRNFRIIAGNYTGPEAFRLNIIDEHDSLIQRITSSDTIDNEWLQGYATMVHDQNTVNVPSEVGTTEKTIIRYPDRLQIDTSDLVSDETLEIILRAKTTSPILPREAVNTGGVDGTFTTSYNILR